MKLTFHSVYVGWEYRGSQYYPANEYVRYEYDEAPEPAKEKCLMLVAAWAGDGDYLCIPGLGEICVTKTGVTSFALDKCLEL